VAAIPDGEGVIGITPASNTAEITGRMLLNGVPTSGVLVQPWCEQDGGWVSKSSVHPSDTGHFTANLWQNYMWQNLTCRLQVLGGPWGTGAHGNGPIGHVRPDGTISRNLADAARFTLTTAGHNVGDILVTGGISYRDGGTLTVNVTDSTGAPVAATIQVASAGVAPADWADIAHHNHIAGDVETDRSTATFKGLLGEFNVLVRVGDGYAPGLVTAEGTLTPLMASAEVFTVNPGDTTYVNVQLVRATTFLSGTVTLNDEPVDRAGVFLFDQNGFGSITRMSSMASGRFRIPVHPGSDFQIAVTARDHGSIRGVLVDDCSIIRTPANVDVNWNNLPEWNAWVAANPGREFRVGATGLDGVEINLSPGGGCGSSLAIATFRDVPEGTTFFHEIEWLASTGITTGWDMGTHREFRPTANIERQAMAAFLHRSRGTTQYGWFTAPGVPTFTDKPVTGDFFRNVEWLAYTGITTGWDMGTHQEFRPTANIERQAMAAFLYRSRPNDGSPTFTPPSTATFRDVPVGAAFFREIEWLASTGITTGWDMGTHREFRPTANVERQAMAAFLYRAVIGQHIAGIGW